jgi:voltage-gated potassium channel
MKWWRKWRASWRDTLLLLGEFRNPLLFFSAAILSGGLLYEWIARQNGEALTSTAQAIYLVLSLAFFQASESFPTHPALQAFFFIMPLIGLITLAQGLADFGILLFNRRARGKEWEMAVASTFHNHTILVGLGHLGYRVIKNLHAMDEPAVAIQLDPTVDLVATVQGMGIPVIQDDAARQSALEAAGIREARTIVLCTQNDSLNLQIAVKARKLNPNIRVVIRIFDDEFAESIQQQFGFSAISATSMAAPAFAAAAAGADLTRPITVEGTALSLARLNLGAQSKFCGISVEALEQRYEITVVLLRRGEQPDLHPSGERILATGDALVCLGSPQNLNQVVHDNQ